MDHTFATILEARRPIPPATLAEATLRRIAAEDARLVRRSRLWRRAALIALVVGFPSALAFFLRGLATSGFLTVTATLTADLGLAAANATDSAFALLEAFPADALFLVIVSLLLPAALFRLFPAPGPHVRPHGHAIA